MILQSARTYYTVGATGYLSDRRAKGMADIKGYTLTGGVSRRVTPFQSVGMQYAYGRQDIPLFSTDMTSHTLEGTYDAQLGRRWKLDARAGFFVTEVQSASLITLDPILASILGTRTLRLQSNAKNTFPSGGISLRRSFKQANLDLNYQRSVGAGNGLIAAARLENGTVGFGYSGVRKWNFGFSGGYYSAKDLLRSTGSAGVFSAGGGLTYDMGHSLHLSVRFDARHVDIDNIGNLRRDSSRTTFGILFSPGEFPLSLW